MDTTREVGTPGGARNDALSIQRPAAYGEVTGIRAGDRTQERETPEHEARAIRMESKNSLHEFIRFPVEIVSSGLQIHCRVLS